MISLSDWPDDLVHIFAAIGSAMAAGRLHPKVLERVPTGLSAIVAGHEVRLDHLPKGLAARYVIELNGERWDKSTWTFRSGELERLARAATQSLVAEPAPPT